MQKYRKFIKESVQVPLSIWVLVVIILIGLFLRAYNFHAWLDFENDQARDAMLVNQVVFGEKAWPLLGPTMRSSGETSETLFRVGPVYYYFQIVSSFIFGTGAAVKAYPDLLFNVLSIPLLFLFLKKYFENNISLYLAGLYAISFFSIKYSRFAWNPNPIPFFMLLFLLSLYEFFLKREKVPWFWVAACGISLGVGIQLHALMLVLMPLMAAVVLIYLLKGSRKLWKKMLAVFCLVVFINIPQLISEFRTDFANSRALLGSPIKNSQTYKKSMAAVFAADASCTIEANAYVLSSFGKERCGFDYVKMLEDGKAGKAFRKKASWPEVFLVFCFSLAGYLLFFYRFKAERKKERKYFFVLNLLAGLIFFSAMFPVIGSDFDEFRYFVPIFFLPYVLLGLLLDFLLRKNKPPFSFLALLIAVFFLGVNIFYLGEAARKLASGQGNDGHAVFLGEVEKIFDQMKNASKNSSRVFYLNGEKAYVKNILAPTSFVARRRGFDLIDVSEQQGPLPKGVPLFYITESRKDFLENSIGGFDVKSVKDFGQLRLYELNNQ